MIDLVYIFMMTDRSPRFNSVILTPLPMILRSSHGIGTFMFKYWTIHIFKMIWWTWFIFFCMIMMLHTGPKLFSNIFTTLLEPVEEEWPKKWFHDQSPQKVKWLSWDSNKQPLELQSDMLLAALCNSMYNGLSLSQTPRDCNFQFEITVVWDSRSWNVKNI